MKHTKIVLLTAAVVMMTQALGLSAAAEEETSAQSGEESVIDADSLSSDESSKETLTSGDYSYTLDGDNATITKYNGSETAVTIPDKLDGAHRYHTGQRHICHQGYDHFDHHSGNS